MIRLASDLDAFERVREAVCAIALRDGAARVTQRSVAAELGVSASSLRRLMRSPDSLPDLGLELVDRLRRIRYMRSGRPPRGAVAGADQQVLAWQAIDGLFAWLPADQEELDELVIWHRLVAAHPGHSELATRSQKDMDEGCAALTTAVVEALAVEMPGVDERWFEPAFEQIRLRALVDGVVAAACDGRMSATAASALVRQHLEMTLGGPLPEHPLDAQTKPGVPVAEDPFC